MKFTSTFASLSVLTAFAVGQVFNSSIPASPAVTSTAVGDAVAANDTSSSIITSATVAPAPVPIVDNTTTTTPVPAPAPIVDNTTTTTPIVTPPVGNITTTPLPPPVVNNDTLIPQSTFWVTDVEVVTAYTTYCPEPTEIIHGNKTITVTAPTTLTVTDCPCTLTETRCETTPGGVGTTKTLLPKPEPVVPTTVKSSTLAAEATTPVKSTTLAPQVSSQVKSSTLAAQASTPHVTLHANGAAKVVSSGLGLAALVFYLF
ncbi:hypothetical protein RNJ44_03731 [Nakaseomyces bracarensis]|uniref:Uncharacterized protein n=1 Tax=Nakaseomyces bracarensis TaxID=273131 RepID=A0ABR4NXS2_9SACH